MNSSSDSPRGSSSLESNASSSTNSIEPHISLPRPPPLPPLPQHFTRSIASEVNSTVNSQSNSHNLVFTNPNRYEYEFNVINQQNDSRQTRSINEDSNINDQLTSILLNGNSRQATSFRSYTNFDENLVFHEERAINDFSNSQVFLRSLTSNNYLKVK